MTTDEPESAGADLRPAVPPAESGVAPAEVPPKPLEWRVPGLTVLVKAVGTVLLLGAALLLAREAAGMALALLAAVAVGLYAVRDLLAPVRLAADTEGVTVVTGYATRRRIPWRQVERIRIDERTRLGVRAALLEIDTGSTLHLFGASELGTPVEDVADALRHLRTGR